MKAFPLLLIFTLKTAFAQELKTIREKHYFSLRGALVSPVGIFDNSYHGGFSINGIMHFKWVKKGAEVQLITGYERFPPREANFFGAISAIPVKMGLLQMISKQFYLYGRIGIFIVKDETTKYDVRFSTDAGLGYAFGKFAIDIGFHGWLRKNNGGFTNYLSTGIIFPFKR